MHTPTPHRFSGASRGGWTTIESGNENDTGEPTIVVIGGLMQEGEYITNSTIVWDPSIKRWRNGPSLNDRRTNLVAVVCHDKVYAIGGYGGDDITTLDTIESIQVSSLLETTETSMTTRQNDRIPTTKSLVKPNPNG